MPASFWRSITVVAMLLLAGCGYRSITDSARQPGLDVADAALRGGTPQVALQVVTGILERDPSNTAALALNGDALTALGRYEEAEASFKRALDIDKRSARANVGLGRLRLGSDPAGAETLFLTALQADPRDAVALNNLGIALDLLGKHEAAQVSYGQALGVRPDFPAAQVNLALSMAMTGKADRAERMIRPLATDPGASKKLRHDYAAVLAMGGKKAEAAKLLSADLSPAQVKDALASFDRARKGAAQALMPTTPE